MDAVIPNKCYSCGKTFRDEHNFKRHKNKKTPCLIRDIADVDLKNPLRCIYCNKISSNKGNLDRHLTSCKVKNGGLNVLYDKTRYEETIRIIREETDQKLNETKETMQKTIEQLQKTIEDMQKDRQKDREEMQKMIESRSSAIQETSLEINNTTNNSITNNNNITNNTDNSVNITINNCNNPNYKHVLEFEQFKEILSHEQLLTPVKLACNIYFDPTHPENASVHLVDQETKHVIAMMDGKWNTMPMEKVLKIIREVGYDVAIEGVRLFYHKNATQEQKDFILSKYELCRRIIASQNNPDAERLDNQEIENTLVSEYTNSARHPAVIAEKQRLKNNKQLAKKMLK